MTVSKLKLRRFAQTALAMMVGNFLRSFRTLRFWRVESCRDFIRIDIFAEIDAGFDQVVGKRTFPGAVWTSKYQQERLVAQSTELRASGLPELASEFAWLSVSFAPSSMTAPDGRRSASGETTRPSSRTSTVPAMVQPTFCAFCAALIAALAPMAANSSNDKSTPRLRIFEPS